MRHAVSCSFLLAMILLANPADAILAQDAVPADMATYVARPEPEYGWKHIHSRRVMGTTEHRLMLTSQTWQGITWKHYLQVFEPHRLEETDKILLFVTAGNIGEAPSASYDFMGAGAAKNTGARIAILHQVPNQPLLGDHVEDDLITESWLRYLQTGDANWPLLFPMVKSAVKAMDALEDFVATSSNHTVDGFVITGASKRGWTSWLAPSVDKRIIATAPVVIDVLNFRPQMIGQLKSWGEFSEQIQDYTSKGLVKLENESERETRLRVMMDPHTYHREVEIPKLMVIATNDRYWVINSLNIYWDDLQGPKHVSYVPNTGHYLSGELVPVMKTICAFFKRVATQQPMPAFQWKHDDHEDGFRLTVSGPDLPRSARLWVAHSEDLDFRDARWTPRRLRNVEGEFTVTVPRPGSGHVAFYASLYFRDGTLKYSLSTQVRRE
ncbi:MAG: PhoPQ-activated protein PqaA family protein [Planctomycetota bacterium]|nr:PhoPQ-activated protein PqaA family protein [Planctomycetota bacterium]